jgi:phytoene dehydrogenase-like protein
VETLIIGAGVAGLAAAQTLAAAGVRTGIIEARNRIGGRILTIRAGKAGLPLELGAEFIHGKPPIFSKSSTSQDWGSRRWRKSTNTSATASP